MILRRTQPGAARRAIERGAFTLMEVLVVAAIIVILAGVGGVVYTNYLEKAREDKAYLDVKMLSEQVEAYRVSYGSYPGSLQELAVRQQDGKPAFLEESNLVDPWNQQYQYNPNDVHPATLKPHVYTMAPGGKMIANW